MWAVFIKYPLKSSYVGKPLSQALLKGMLITMEDLRTVYYKLLDAESEIKEETCNLLYLRNI